MEPIFRQEKEGIIELDKFPQPIPQPARDGY